MRIYEDELIYIDIDHHSTSAINIIFSDFTKMKIRLPFWREYNDFLGISGCFITAKLNHFYQGKKIEKALHSLTPYLNRYHACTLVGVGMGGYAALRHSAILQADSVISISPTPSSSIPTEAIVDESWEQGICSDVVAGDIHLVYDSKNLNTLKSIHSILESGVKAFLYPLGYSGDPASQSIIEITGSPYYFLSGKGIHEKIRENLQKAVQLYQERWLFTSSTIVETTKYLSAEERHTFLRDKKNAFIYMSNYKSDVLHKLFAETDSTDADKDYLSALLMIKNKKPEEAISFLSSAVEKETGNAYWHFQLAKLLVQLKQFVMATIELQKAIKIATHPTSRYAVFIPDWYYRLGLAYDCAKQPTDAAAAYKAGLFANKYHTELESILLQDLDKFASRQKIGIPFRLSIGRYIQDITSELNSKIFPKRNFFIHVLTHIPNLLARKRSFLNTLPPKIVKRTNININKTIFMYWGQGRENTPRIVEKCFQSIERHSKGWDVVILDQGSLERYITLPEHIYQLHNCGIMRASHFADIVRVALLAKYGGCWMDATCYCTTSLYTLLSSLMRHSFFSYRYTHTNISNWFLTANAGSYIASMMEKALCSFWCTFRSSPYYFHFHAIFATLYRVDSLFKSLWDKTPFISSHPPHLLQRSMKKALSDTDLERIYKGSPIHKLTHKFDLNAIPRDSFLIKLLTEP